MEAQHGREAGESFRFASGAGEDFAGQASDSLLAVRTLLSSGPSVAAEALAASRPRAVWNDPALRRAILAAIDRRIAEIDRLIAEQVDALLRHPRLQQLEASWRGLHYLVTAADRAEGVQIRALVMSWAELCRDVERAIEFDQSALFAKIYSDEFGMPGGQPYGLLVADYYVQHLRSRDHPTDDAAALRGLSQVAAAAFAPVVVGCNPRLFGLDSFRDLHVGLDLQATFAQPEYTRWRSLQESEDSRFVGIVLPRILMRRPRAHDGTRHDGFRYAEGAPAAGHDGYLWGNPVYAFASVAVRSFATSGWFAEMRGTRPGMRGGSGLVPDLVVDEFTTDRAGIATKMVTEVSVSERQEKELSDFGLIPLMRNPNTDFGIFYGNQSIHQPRRYDRAIATANAKLSAMLQYILCVSRFAHYIKIIGRDRIGALTTPEACEEFLQRWLTGYCIANEDAGPEMRARYPLRHGQIQVRELPGRPGSFTCIAHLQPHFQVDQVASSFRLVTELAPAKPEG